MATFIIKYGTWLYIPFALVGVIALELISTPQPAAIKWACLYLGLPIVVLTVVFVRRCHEQLMARMRGGIAVRRLQVYVSALVFCPVTLVICAGYIVLADAFVGRPHAPVIYQGIVVAKTPLDPRDQGCVITVQNQQKWERIRFRLGPPESKIIDVGAHYSRAMKLGFLGIPYRYRSEN